MGYSLSVHFLDKEEQNKMSHFLTTQFTEVTKFIVQLPNYGKIFNPVTNPNFIGYKRVLDSPPYSKLGYDKAKNKLGYNFSLLESIESYYCQQILSWMAIKSNKKYTYGERLLSTIIYDGKQQMPIYLSNLDCIADVTVCKKEISENNGFSKYVSISEILLQDNKNHKLTKFDEEQIEDATVMSSLVQAELHRLDTEWGEFNK